MAELQRSGLTIYYKSKDEFKKVKESLMVGFYARADLPAYHSWSKYITKFKGCEDWKPSDIGKAETLTDTIIAVHIQGGKERYPARVVHAMIIRKEGRPFYRLTLSYLKEQ